MKKFRRTIVKYERGFLIGLVIVLLIIFVVASDIVDMLGTGRASGALADNRAGSFSVLPGEEVEVTWDRFNQAYRRFELGRRVLLGGAPGTPAYSEVWTHIALLEAARREGISVPASELHAALRQTFGELLDDRAGYKQAVRQYFGVPAAELELSLLELLTTQRLLDLHADSYRVAPAVSREDLFKDYVAAGNIEHVRASWASLDARAFLQDARDELKADADPDKALREFFEKDPAVRAEQFKFQHPRRIKFEVIYTAHERLGSAEDWARVLALFKKMWPARDPEKLEPKQSEIEEYFNLFRDRLLAQKDRK
ncbi:MAG: hypothetical protein ACREID_00630, partial [Planctomycetota bacterium]